MSHIVAFKIEGLASRPDPLEMELNRDTNIFFGLNGCGKTSLLKILHAAMANETGILRRVPFLSAEVHIYSLTWDKVFVRSLKKAQDTKFRRSKTRRVVHREVLIDNEIVIVEEPGIESKLKWSCSPKTPEEAATTRWAHEYLPTSRLHVSDKPMAPFYESSGSSRTFLTEDQLDVFFARSVENLWSRYSAQILGAVRKAQEQGLASILRAVLAPQRTSGKRKKSKLTSDTAYNRVNNFLKRQGSATILGSRKAFDKRYAADATLQDVVQDIDVVENKIQSSMESRNSLQELISNMFMANKQIQFTDESIDVTTPSGDRIGLASLSSGEKHLLRILVQALLVGESSLMIDEPEISMHVDWQKVFIESMRKLNSDAQLIIATHSPEIMADVKDEKIFRI